MSDDLYPRPTSDRDNARLFNRLVRPTLIGTPSEDPSVLFITGQPGAGKTTVQDTLLARLGRPDTFPLDGDDLLTQHPRYEQFQRSNDFTGTFLASEDLKARWWNRTARLLRIQRLDIAISAPLAAPDWASSRFAEFRRAGYSIGVVYVATHEAMSLQGIVDRYHRDRQSHSIGYGRWIPPQWHDTAYSGVLDTADRIDTTRAIDTVYVARRDGTILHTNQLDPDGTWALGVATRQVVEAEQARTWTATESTQFLQKQGQLRQELSSEWTPLLDNIDRRAIPVIAPLAVHDDSQLAARQTEVAGLLRQVEREAEAAKLRQQQAGEAHRSGANAARLEDLRTAGHSDAELRQTRDTMHQERWNTNMTAFGLTRRIAGANQLLVTIGEERQRRATLAPAGRHREERARQHLQQLAAQPAAPQPVPHPETPRHSAPQRRGPRQGL